MSRKRESEKGTGEIKKSFICLVEGCGVVKPKEREWIGQMIMKQQQRADRVIDERTGEIKWELKPAVEEDSMKGWMGLYKKSEKDWRDARESGIIDAWGVALKKGGWQKGKGRATKLNRPAGEGNRQNTGKGREKKGKGEVIEVKVEEDEDTAEYEMSGAGQRGLSPASGSESVEQRRVEAALLQTARANTTEKKKDKGKQKARKIGDVSIVRTGEKTGDMSKLGTGKIKTRKERKGENLEGIAEKGNEPADEKDASRSERRSSKRRKVSDSAAIVLQGEAERMYRQVERMGSASATASSVEITQSVMVSLKKVNVKGFRVSSEWKERQRLQVENLQRRKEQQKETTETEEKSDENNNEEITSRDRSERGKEGRRKGQRGSELVEEAEEEDSDREAWRQHLGRLTEAQKVVERKVEKGNLVSEGEVAGTSGLTRQDLRVEEDERLLREVVTLKEVQEQPKKVVVGTLSELVTLNMQLEKLQEEGRRREVLVTQEQLERERKVLRLKESVAKWTEGAAEMVNKLVQDRDTDLEVNRRYWLGELLKGIEMAMEAKTRMLVGNTEQSLVEFLSTNAAAVRERKERWHKEEEARKERWHKEEIESMERSEAINREAREKEKERLRRREEPVKLRTEVRRTVGGIETRVVTDSSEDEVSTEIRVDKEMKDRVETREEETWKRIGDKEIEERLKQRKEECKEQEAALKRQESRGQVKYDDLL